MSPPIGWYPDVDQAGAARWWDGSAWRDAPPAGQLRMVPHPTLPLLAGVGALLAVFVPLVVMRVVIRALTEFEWPIIVYVAISGVLGYGPVIVWCRYVSRRWGTGRVLSDVGVRGVWEDAGWGPLTWLGCLITQIVVGVVVVATRIPTASNTDGFGRAAEDRVYLVSLLVLAVVAAPIVEEIAFRGVVLRALLGRMGAVWAIGLQAVVFGVAHVDPARGVGNVGLALVLSAVGAALGTSAYLFRRIVPAMIAHAILNGLALTLVLSGAADRLSGN